LSGGLPVDADDQPGGVPEEVLQPVQVERVPLPPLLGRCQGLEDVRVEPVKVGGISVHAAIGEQG
jgi:hypothetical protein